jgi:serine protease AprX
LKKRALVCLALLAAFLQPGPAQAASAGARFDPDLTALLDSDPASVGVIIQYASPPTDADGEALLDAGFLPGLVRYSVVPAVSAVGPASAVRKLAANPRITYVEDDELIPYTLDRATLAGRASQIWDATYKLSDEVHDTGFTGRDVGIAIVDSGIDATHPDLIWEPAASAAGLEPKTTANFKIIGRDSPGLYSDDPELGPFFEANQLTVDVPHSDNTGGHGTHVAGIAGGNGASSDGRFKGAAPGANLIGYGAGETLVVTMGLAAFDHIHLHHDELGIRVVNNSWGGAGEWDPDSSITKAARRLVNEDRLAVVFAAGNSGGDGTTLQSSVWGNIPEVIQVANYYDRTGWLDSSSSRGRRDREDTWPDIAAPGTQIISTAATGGPVTYFGSGQDALLDELIGGNVEPTVVPVQTPVTVGDDTVLVGNYASFTGTSMAAPFVSGVIALILEANEDLQPEQVKEILRETANMPVGRTYLGDGFGIGKGVVDAAEAVAVALRMREGAPLDEALATAYVDTTTTPYKLNVEEARSLEIASPTTGADVHTSVDVTGRAFAGSTTVNSIPLAPEPTEPGEPVVVSDAASGGDVFSDDFEGAAEGWTIEQNAVIPPGQLTSWRHTTDAPGAFYGAHSGSGWYQATIGPPPAEAYTDGADVTLVSPVIDLRDRSSAFLTYWRAGASEGNLDFFEVSVDPEGAAPPHLLERLSGTLLIENVGSWSQSPVFRLSRFIGEQVRLRFRFVSNEFSIFPPAPGWSVDDVKVVATDGPSTAILRAVPATGVAPLDSTIDFDYWGKASSYEVDFGDGTSHTASDRGQVAHVYEAGEYTAALTVKDAAGAVLGTATEHIEVLPREGVQLRLVHAGGSTPWVTAPTSASGEFARTFDISGLPLGPATAEARYTSSRGHVMRRSVTFDVVSPPPTNGTPTASDDFATVRSGAQVVIPVLANDTDPDADVLTLHRVDTKGTAGGTVVDRGDGTVLYSPPPSFLGRETFTYTVSDPSGATDDATVVVDVKCSKTTKKRPGIKRCK